MVIKLYKLIIDVQVFKLFNKQKIKTFFISSTMNLFTFFVFYILLDKSERINIIGF